MKDSSDSLASIIRESLYRATKRDIVLTPFSYYKIFVEVALEKGIDKAKLHQYLYGDSEVSSIEFEQLKKKVLEIATNIKDVTENVEKKLEKSSSEYESSIKNLDSYTDSVDKNIMNELERIKYINQSLKDELEAARHVLEKQKNAIENIKELSLRDQLTGLYLRRHMNEVLDDLLYNFKRYKKVFSVIMMDLDDFKAINDTYGHLAGDEVLKTVATILKRYTRQSDIPFRYGGDEFIVLLPETQLEDALVVAEKIRKKISSIKFKKNDLEFTCSVSLGVTQVKEGDSVESILERVDEALYKTKRTSKGEITVL